MTPRALHGPSARSPADASLTVLTANLRYGNADPEAVVALARRSGADLVSLQELPAAEDRAPSMPQVHASCTRTACSTREGDVQGSGLLSRYPLTAAARPRQSAERDAGGDAARAGCAPIRVKAVHPVTPLHDDVGLWEHSLRSLPRATPRGGLRMLVGDFNATLDHHLLRDVIGSGYADAGDAPASACRARTPRTACCGSPSTTCSSTAARA